MFKQNLQRILALGKFVRIRTKTQLLVVLAVLVAVSGLGTYVEHKTRLISGVLPDGPTSGLIGTNNSTGELSDEFAEASRKEEEAEEDEKKKESESKKTTTSKSNSSTSGSTGSKTSGGTSKPRIPSKPPVVPPYVPPPAAPNHKFGMSAPVNKWQERLAEVGTTNLKFRRLFYQTFDDNLSRVGESLAAGMTPVISWKTGDYSWREVADGDADHELYDMVARLNAISGPKYLTIHHEPSGDGTPQDFVAMQLHALPILSSANQVSVGVIANGWWWSGLGQGYSDAEIAEWIPSSLKNVCDYIAADTYQDVELREDGGVKAARFAAWAKRTGGVRALGIGEFNGFTGESITNLMNVVKAEPLFKWALVWNSGPSGLGTPLEGERLQAFKDGKASPNPL